MFGYIVPYKPEMKVKDYEVFQSYYCGLCKSMGRNYNSLVRLGLNYDLTFLAIVLSSLEEKKDEFAREGCIANPLKKKSIMHENGSLSYTAGLSVIMIYFKMLDDWKDEKSIKALLSSFALKRSMRKAKREHKEKYSSIKSSLEELSRLERENCSVVDQAADAFGTLMENIACPEEEKYRDDSRALKFMGYNLGRWIYILDAYKDIEEDLKKDSYNPLILQYEYSKGESVESFKSRIKEKVELSLFFTLDNISKSFELLNFRKNREIIENIVYMGMRHKTEAILGEPKDVLI